MDKQTETAIEDAYVAEVEKLFDALVSTFSVGHPSKTGSAERFRVGLKNARDARQVALSIAGEEREE